MRKTRNRRIARLLFLDSKLTIHQIAALLNVSDMTVYRWRDAAKWTEEDTALSLDGGKNDAEGSLCMVLRNTKQQAVKGIFDDDFCRSAGAAKKLADVLQTLIDLAPFDSAKSMIEAIVGIKGILDNMKMPEMERKIVSTFLESVYMEILDANSE